MDKILQMFFESDRWEYALNKGVDKHISKSQLYQLTKPETRAAMYQAIKEGHYEIAPPHTAQIPKDNGDFRTVYINEPMDRVFLSIANDLLFKPVPEDDPIFAAIVTSQTVPNRRLFRRWVMAQMFHMLTQKKYGERYPMGFTEALNCKGYKYSWEMAVEEYRVQTKLSIDDKENFAERNRWFNKAVAVVMAEHYMTQLKAHVKTLKTRKCKGVPYVHLYKRDIFVSDLQAKVYRPLYKALDFINRARTPQQLYSALNEFYRKVKKVWLSFDTPQCPEFKDAYKGVGAFYTLKNLILFHGCQFPTASSTHLSMGILYGYVNDKNLEGYKMLGILKEFLSANNINIEAKMAEWRK